jgi:hypothetical protein
MNMPLREESTGLMVKTDGEAVAAVPEMSAPESHETSGNRTFMVTTAKGLELSTTSN